MKNLLCTIILWKKILKSHNDLTECFWAAFSNAMFIVTRDESKSHYCYLKFMCNWLNLKAFRQLVKWKGPHEPSVYLRLVFNTNSAGSFCPLVSGDLVSTLKQIGSRGTKMVEACNFMVSVLPNPLSNYIFRRILTSVNFISIWAILMPLHCLGPRPKGK